MLRCVNIPLQYPLESFQSPCGAFEPGIVQLVERADRLNTPSMTVEEVQRLGAIDPVAVAIDRTKPWLRVSNDEDGPKILNIIKNFKVNDDEITRVLGLCPTDRERAMHLFSGGNIVVDSVKVVSGKLRTGAQQPVWIIEADVVASRRTRVYSTRVTFDQVLTIMYTHTHTHILIHTHIHRPQERCSTNQQGLVNVWRTLDGAHTRLH